MSEMAGSNKIKFIAEKLYWYRVHDACNFKVMRSEQLRNNWDIRRRMPRCLQTKYFDYTFDLDKLEKAELHEIGPRYRKDIPLPYTIHLRHHIGCEEVDSWISYHGLWIDDGVFLSGVKKKV
jgi:hypothetical protein